MLKQELPLFVYISLRGLALLLWKAILSKLDFPLPRKGSTLKGAFFFNFRVEPFFSEGPDV